MGLEGGGVHGDEDVGMVPGSEDVVVRYVDLERRHPGDRTGRRPYFSREVGQRSQVVAEKTGTGRETVAHELHPITRVTGEPDDDPVQGGQRVPFSNYVSQSPVPSSSVRVTVYPYLPVPTGRYEKGPAGPGRGPGLWLTAALMAVGLGSAKRCRCR